jgi:plastin-1
MTENQNLALNAAKAIGCQVINIGAQDLIEGRPHLVLGLVWQVIRIQLLAQITLRNVPELVLLLEEEETLADFLKLHPELILLRWLNYHLAKAGSTRTVKNFGSDLSVSSDAIQLTSPFCHRVFIPIFPSVQSCYIMSRTRRCTASC